MIMNEKGNLLRRNRQHLIPTNEEFTLKTREQYQDTPDTTHTQVMQPTPPNNNNSSANETPRLDSNTTDTPAPTQADESTNVPPLPSISDPKTHTRSGRICTKPRYLDNYRT